MTGHSENEITRLLKRWSAGDREAARRALPHVYEQLHRIAARIFRREREGHTLQATALVGEAYVVLVEQRGLSWRDRSHFFAVAANVMRRVLVDHARHRLRDKRGGAHRRVTLAEADALSRRRPTDLLALDDALSALAGVDERKATIVELKFFGGLNNEEVAGFLAVSRATVVREWTRAKAWLYAELEAESLSGGRDARAG